MQFDLLGKAVRRFRLPAVDYVNAPSNYNSPSKKATSIRDISR